MIKHISISNYALIKSLDLDLSNGLTTITGETGAGKSILLGALGLALGNRADSKVMADAKAKCVVEVTFDVSNLHLKSFFADHDLDFEPDCLIRREITPAGKSRSFVNDTPVRLDVLKKLSERLVDIHSQHDSVLMMNGGFQLEMVDLIGDHAKLRATYSGEFNTYKMLLKQREDILNSKNESRDLDYLGFLHQELVGSQLIANEEETLENELKLLRHAGEVQQGLGASIQALNEDGKGIDNVSDALRQMESIKGFLEGSNELTNRLNAAEIELRDIVGELEQQAESVFVDDQRLAELEERWNAINQLMQKHHVSSVAELIVIQQDLNNQIVLANKGEARIAEINKAIAKQLAVLEKAGEALHAKRLKTAKALVKEANSYLMRLNLESAALDIQIHKKETPTSNGVDQIAFYFTANAGRQPQLLKKVASGGELSRVMLALKAILSKTRSLPAIIFDEIDAGISGETAHRVADVLSEMGEEMQVLAITHLPQIAARGKQHLTVRKSNINKQTNTHILQLSKNQRVEEVARLLSGERISDSAKKTAEELLG